MKSREFLIIHPRTREKLFACSLIYDIKDCFLSKMTLRFDHVDDCKILETFIELRAFSSFIQSFGLLMIQHIFMSTAYSRYLTGSSK